MKLEVIKRQGFHTDLTSSQLGTKLRTDDFADGGTGENRPHACGGTDLFEERGTGVTVNILFSDGKCGLVITVKGKKNLLRYEKKNCKINVFIWIKGVFGFPFSKI